MTQMIVTGTGKLEYQIYKSFIMRKIVLSAVCMFSAVAFPQTGDIIFSESFDSSESMEKFIKLDVNNDKETWVYNTIVECARSANLFDPNDDWLVTPAFNVEKGSTYKVSFKVGGNYGSKLEVGMGNEATDEELSRNIIMDMVTYDGNQYSIVEREFVSQETGEWYIGFHSLGDGMFCTVDVDDIVITKTASAPAEDLRLYGTIVSADNTYTPGIYSFGLSEEVELQLEAGRSDYISNGGGVYVDGKYYFTMYMIMSDRILCNYNIYNFSTGNTNSVINEGMSYIASDMAYDPTTDNIYCCSVTDDKGYVLSIMDRETGEKDPVGKMEQMSVIAADMDGIIYGVSSEGLLYSIDKNTAELTLIGDTGERGMEAYVQSGTIDPETGRFFWAKSTATETGIYEIDKETAETVKIGSFPNNEHITGLFVKKEFFGEDAPERCQTEVLFENGNLEGNMLVTVPVRYSGGAAIEENMTLTVMVDNEIYTVEESVQPGDEVSVPVSVEESGWHEFVAYVTSAGGERGMAANKRMFVGHDAPQPVYDVVLENDGKNMYVSWKIHPTGINGGYVDTENVRYSIQRYPDYVWLEESYSGTEYVDVLDSDAMKTYSYGIVANYEGQSSEMVVSNFVTVGSMFEIPFNETFEVEPLFANWTIIDANNDGYTWAYSYGMRAAIYEWSVTEPTADDWLVSPQFELKAGTEYELKLDVMNSIPDEPEKVEVFLGTDSSVESMTRELIPLTEINDNTKWTNLQKKFTEEKGGVYRLGIRVSSETHIGDLLVRNIGIDFGPSAVDRIEEQGLEVISGAGVLHVTNRLTEDAAVYSVDGVYRATVCGGETRMLNLESGLYIVRSSSEVIKVMVE